MLVKFFDPTSGELEFNGYPSNSISKSSLRSYINYGSIKYDTNATKVNNCPTDN